MYVFMKSIQFQNKKPVKNFVLEAFMKKSINGQVVDENGQKVLTPKGEEIDVANFGGIIKGSTLYLKSNIKTLLEYGERIASYDDLGPTLKTRN